MRRRTWDVRCGLWDVRPTHTSPVLRLTSAFTLVEVVIALVILAVGLVATMTMFPVGLKAGRRATTATEAALMAGRVLEEIHLAGYDGLVADPPAVPLSGEQGRYQYQVAVSEPTLEGIEPSAAVRRVDVTVSWQEEGAARRETFVTYVAR